MIEVIDGVIRTQELVELQGEGCRGGTDKTCWMEKFEGPRAE
jgi:hypothetical protein